MRKKEVEKRIAEVREDGRRVGVFINNFLFEFDKWKIEYEHDYVYLRSLNTMLHIGFCIGYADIFIIK